MTNHAVVIVGAGPTGLMLACELALARVDAIVVERREDQTVAGSRAGGLHPRSLEVLDQRGVAERFVSQGRRHPVAFFAGAALDISDLPTRHNYSLGLFQEHIERTLAEWATELGVRILRGREVTAFEEGAEGARVTLSDGASVRAQWLVGCDGGRSLIRKCAGIDFPGWASSLSYLIAECEAREEPPLGVRYGEKGVNAIGKLEDGKRLRMVLTEKDLRQGDAPTIDDLREALVDAHGSDFGVHGVTWLSRFTDAARQAATYRKGRVLLAGDAAHVHSPTGGQGLNLGLQDAVNLGWKLAQVVRGTSPDSLLDTYHSERHPVGARVLKNTLAMTALSRGDDRSTALRELMAESMRWDEPRKRYGAMVSSLDIHYDFGAGHPLLGRRMPDLDIETESGPARVYTLLQDGRPLLLDFGSQLDVGAFAGRVRCVEARGDGAWELPVVGRVAAPSGVLIRPDGHVAWVGQGNDDGLREAVRFWFGA